MAGAGPADILSAVSDSTEGCTVASECNFAGRADCKSVLQPPLEVTVLSFRIHREMLVLEVLGNLRRLFGLDLFTGSG
jgi:hypothetical protein